MSIHVHAQAPVSPLRTAPPLARTTRRDMAAGAFGHRMTDAYERRETTDEQRQIPALAERPAAVALARLDVYRVSSIARGSVLECIAIPAPRAEANA